MAIDVFRHRAPRGRCRPGRPGVRAWQFRVWPAPTSQFLDAYRLRRQAWHTKRRVGARARKAWWETAAARVKDPAVMLVARSRAAVTVAFRAASADRPYRPAPAATRAGAGGHRADCQSRQQLLNTAQDAAASAGERGRGMSLLPRGRFGDCGQLWRPASHAGLGLMAARGADGRRPNEHGYRNRQSRGGVAGVDRRDHGRQ